MENDAELFAWLRLTQSRGLGQEAVRRLLAALGSPEAVLDAGPSIWRAVAGAAAAQGLTETSPAAEAAYQATRTWLQNDPDHHALLHWGDERYPPALLQTADPPPLLWAQGRLALLQRPSLAMVGSRNASAQGLDNARAFASHLSRGGLTIVSGLALGIDGAAHEGALEGAGSTIGVVGTGLDVVYPRRHARLWQRVASEGLILSEFAPGTPPLQANFPRRNRVIAGLALGTLVVEAAMQSGSLITARLALEAGREVLAIPGSIHSPQARGCLHLIQQGAKLVTSAEDILQELPAWARQAGPAAAPANVPAPPAGDPPRDDPDAPFWRALGHDPVSLDALVARCGWPAAELSTRLLTLELEGRVARLPGGLYQRRASA